VRTLPVRLGVAGAALALLTVVPFLHVGTGGVFPADLSTPGTLQLLAQCVLFAGLALTYDLLFGYTGLLSFGHALPFAVGVYMGGIALTRWHWGFATTILFVAAVGLLLPVLLGAVGLRVGGIAFAMVTLAYAQAGQILVQKNPWGWTGGEEGIGLDVRHVPAAFIGVLNTKNLYWLALGYTACVAAIVWWAVDSSPGRWWQAIRENELRTAVLGLQPYRYKLLAFALSSFLATLGGIVYLLLFGGATPEVTTANFTLTLLIMVVLGGAGSRWGALLGGALYVFADNRLLDIAGSKTVGDLPGVLRTPLSEPLFVLGTLFILLVFFIPGGIAGLAAGAPRRGLRAIEGVVRRGPAGSAAEIEAAP